MTNLFYFQVEEVPGSRTIIFFSFNYPILLTYLFIYLSTILMFDFSSFIYIYLHLFTYFLIYLLFFYLFIYLFINY